MMPERRKGKSPRMAPSILLGGALLGTLVLLGGCSGKSPVISRVVARPILVHDLGRGSYREQLSVFLVASDPDGADDLSGFSVINDDAELFWSVDSKTWLSGSAEGEPWIGANAISMPGGVPFPEGAYRVLLSDAGGSTAESSFTLSPGRPAAAKAPYPSVTVSDGVIRVKTGLADAEVWVSTRDGRPAARYPADKALDSLSLAAANPSAGKSFSFWVYAADRGGEWAVLTGPYSTAR
jgi:hypothetical protein